MLVNRKYLKNIDKESNIYNIVTYPQPKVRLAVVDGDKPITNNVIGYDIELNRNSKLQLIPDFPISKKAGAEGKRLTMLIVGPSGSGKTTMMINMMLRFKQVNKRGKIYLLTSNVDHKKFEDVKDLTIYNINTPGLIETLVGPEGFTFEPPEVDMFGIEKDNDNISLYNNLICFDDCDCINREEQKLMDEFYKTLLYLQRHSNTHVIWSRHEITSTTNAMLRKSLNEIQYIVLFQSESFRTLKSFLERYLGLSKEYSEVVQNGGSRYTIFSMCVPKHIIQARRLWIV